MAETTSIVQFVTQRDFVIASVRETTETASIVQFVLERDFVVRSVIDTDRGFVQFVTDATFAAQFDFSITKLFATL